MFPATFRQRQVGQPSRQVGAAVQEIDDDHLLDLLDKHHEMLACPREAQVLGQGGVDEPTAIL